MQRIGLRLLIPYRCVRWRINSLTRREREHNQNRNASPISVWKKGVLSEATYAKESSKLNILLMLEKCNF